MEGDGYYGHVYSIQRSEIQAHNHILQVYYLPPLFEDAKSVGNYEPSWCLSRIWPVYENCIEKETSSEIGITLLAFTG